VIAFLVVTSIINLSLGYALAVYLGNAPSFSGRDAGLANANLPLVIQHGALGLNGSQQPLASRPAESVPIWPAGAAGAAGPSAVHATFGATAAEGVPGVESRNASDEEDQEIQNHGALEQDLLAGIEEFRNQLAQLKGQASEGDVPKPQAIGV